MNYIKTLLFLVSLSLIFFFYSCSNDTVTSVNNNTPLDTSAFTYPFSIGSTWNYSRTYTASDIRPDSIRHYFAVNPVTAIGSIVIAYDTTINNISTRCFFEEYSEYRADTTISYGRFYFIITDTSLIEYAYRNHIYRGFTPAKKQKNITLKTKNGSNYALQDIDFYGLGFSSANTSDSLFILYPPETILKFPIKTGTQWIINQGGENLTKKYEQFENVTLSSGIVTCMKVSSTYSILNSVPTYDYYSKYGLMKRYFYINDVVITTPQNPKGVGTADITDEYKITSYRIQP